MPQASILVPTHAHWATLPLAVGSALRQTVADLEVIVIGDGVSNGVRSVARDLCRSDPRVVFLDLPKGPNHGEVHRDLAIRESSSLAIFYLCDDDLLLPKHVENLLALLSDADMAQSRNGYIDSDGVLVLYPTDLADPEAIDWHLKSPRHNATSLTGTAHTRSAYLDLPEGWTTTPPDEWPDHFMWKKFFQIKGFRAATHGEMTALQLPTSSGREHVDQYARYAELLWWGNRLAEPRAHEWIQDMANAAASAQLAVCSRLAVDLSHEVTILQRDVALSQREAETLRDDLTVAWLESQTLREEVKLSRSESQGLAVLIGELELALSRVVSSRSWRMSAPLRRMAESRRDWIQRGQR